MRKWTAVAAGAALSLALVLPGAASAQTSPPTGATRQRIVFSRARPFWRRPMNRWARRSSRCAAVAALGCIPLAGLLPAANAQTFPPLTWTAPVLVEHAPFATGHLVSAASCPRPGLCVVGDDAGDILTSTDPASTTDTWKTTPISPGNTIEFLTCATKTFCVALAAVRGHPTQIFTSVNPTGGRRAWTLANDRLLIRAISCSSPRLCVAVGKGAITTSTDPTAGRRSVWKVTSLGPQLSSTHLTGVSCPGPTLCVAGDDEGNVYTSKNPTGGKSAWTVTLVTTTALKPVTCPSPSFCAALDNFGNLIYSTNPAGGVSAWHQVGGPGGFAKNFTCASATFCAAIEDSNSQFGKLFTTTDPTGGGAAWQSRDISERGNGTALTCASAHLCVAGDFRGDVLSSRSPSRGLKVWATVNVTGVSGIISLDCHLAALCVAGDDAGNVLTSIRPGGGASAWRSTHLEGPPASNGTFAEIVAISCPTTGLCVAVDDQGNALWSTNPTGGASAWTKAFIDTELGFGYAPDSIACPTTSLCIAADNLGNIMTSTNPTGGPSAWQVASMGPNVRPLFVTCATASLCLASADGTIYASTNPAGGVSTWHPSVSFGHNAAIGPITCPRPSSCVAIGVYAFKPHVGSPTIFSSRRPTGGILDWNFVTPMPGSEPGGPVASDATISCPSTGFCLAGFVPSEFFASFDPLSGKASAWQKTRVSATAVSCPNPSLCVAGNDAGQVQIGTPRATTSTALKLSVRRIAYGHEQGERLTVTVRPLDVPTGSVVISAKTKTICTLRRLRHGTASCTLTRKQLRPGTYRLTARYSGSSAFLDSKSAVKVLTVSR